MGHALQLELGYQEAFSFKLQTLDMLHIVSVDVLFPELRESTAHRSQNLMCPCFCVPPLAFFFLYLLSCTFSFFYLPICNRGFLNTLLRRYLHKLVTLPLITSQKEQPFIK